MYYIKLQPVGLIYFDQWWDLILYHKEEWWSTKKRDNYSSINHIWATIYGERINLYGWVEKTYCMFNEAYKLFLQLESYFQPGYWPLDRWTKF
jgi:hypothetical protein